MSPLRESGPTSDLLSQVRQVIAADTYDREEIAFLLSLTDDEAIREVRDAANQTLLQYCSNKVFFRGLIEFSNVCAMDCLYCGIRRTNRKLQRYTLGIEQMVEIACWCAEKGYGSVVMQSGERSDPVFVDLVESAVREIKRATVSDSLPHGVGITLCVGEQTLETYQRFHAAGAHRYLLRIETTNPELFRQIHPGPQSLEHRLECLNRLREAGFQVGTGVMIGLPGQTVEMLADDILFFADQDCDMIGMGPYIVHHDTPLGESSGEDPMDRKSLLRLALLMIGVVRLKLKNVNIAATTALQTIDPLGREKGLRFGANVIMPQLTPTEHRKDYLLYDGKPCVTEEKGDCLKCLEARIASVGRVIGFNEWGDSPHARKRLE